LLLQPRKFKFKTRQKRRRPQPFGFKGLSYGDCGLASLQPLQLSSKQIFRLKIFLKKAVRKSEYTRRFTWFSAFPHLPLTKKTKGMRMGKGVGKLSTWKIRLSGGKVLLEFKNLRFGRAVYFCKQVAHKLPTRTKVLSTQSFNLGMRFARRTNVLIRTYW